MSINSTTGMVMSGRPHTKDQPHEHKEHPQKKEKEHNRSNSTISKKSNKDIKNCFKIDLSKFNKDDHEKRLVLESK